MINNNEQGIIEALDNIINQALLEIQEMAGSTKEEVGSISLGL